MAISILIFITRMCVFSAVTVYLQFSSFQPKWIVICVIYHLIFTRKLRTYFFLDSTSLAYNSQASFSLPVTVGFLFPSYLVNPTFLCVPNLPLFEFVQMPFDFVASVFERHLKQFPNTAIIGFPLLSLFCVV